MPAPPYPSNQVPGFYQSASGLIIPASCDSAGYLLVNVAAGGGAGGTSSTFGAALPGTGTAVGFNAVSGNMEPGNLDASGKLLVSGTFTASPPSSSTASAPSRKTVGTTAVTLLAANAARVAFIVKQSGTITVYIGYGANPSTSAYTDALGQGGSTDDGSIPKIYDTVYKGAIYAICAMAGGAVQVTELT